MTSHKSNSVTKIKMYDEYIETLFCLILCYILIYLLVFGSPKGSPNTSKYHAILSRKVPYNM